MLLTKVAGYDKNWVLNTSSRCYYLLLRMLRRYLLASKAELMTKSVKEMPANSQAKSICVLSSGRQRTETVSVRSVRYFHSRKYFLCCFCLAVTSSSVWRRLVARYASPVHFLHECTTLEWTRQGRSFNWAWRLSRYFERCFPDQGCRDVVGS